MLLFEVFVCKFLAVDRLATSAIATGEVTALEHELGDHAMEFGARVTETLLASAEGAEVLSGLGGGIFVEVEIDTAGLVFNILGRT